MAIKPILKYPSVELRTACQPVDATSNVVRSIVDDLVETMYGQPGAVGLSAPQLGYPFRVVVIDVNAKTTKDDLHVLINPEIIQTSRNKLVREGCLSFPDYLAHVKRATKVTVRYTTPDGVEEEWETRDLTAVAVQHEIDHLDGVLMIDRVNSLKTDLIRRYTAS